MKRVKAIVDGSPRHVSSTLLLVYSVFLLLLYFAWVALFAALLALLIYPILKKLRI